MSEKFTVKATIYAEVINSEGHTVVRKTASLPDHVGLLLGDTAQWTYKLILEDLDKAKV